MKENRTKKGNSLSNVFYLSSYQRAKTKVPKSPIYYLSQKGELQETLSRSRDLHVLDIRSAEQLLSHQAVCPPELILIESTVKWDEPLSLIRTLNTIYQVPIIFVCKGKNTTARNRKTVKEAYAAGACDTFFTPLEPEEIFSALQILLQFQKKQTLYH